MADINIATLRADVLDRLDNAVVVQQMPESLRQKLEAVGRVTKAMNHALFHFVRQADPATISGLVSVVSLSGDTNLGTNSDGKVGGLAVYVWPTAFSERADHGVLNLILDGEEYEIEAGTVTDLDTVKYQSNSAFHGTDVVAFHVNLGSRRIYVPEEVGAKARVIEYPEQIDDADTYGAADDATIPVPDNFDTVVAKMATAHLLNSIGSGALESEPEPETETATEGE